MFNLQKQRYGFTLLELLLVLLVIVGILLASYSRYKRYTQEKDLAVIKQNAAVLQQFADECYAAMQAQKPTIKKPVCSATLTDFTIEHCSSQFNIPKPKLLKSGLVSNTNQYSIGSDLDISINVPPSDPCNSGKYYTHRLTMAVVLDKNKVPASTIDWYIKMLGASTSDKGNQYKIIWQKMPSYTVSGIGNDLWIMGAGLRIFKKTETTN